MAVIYLFRHGQTEYNRDKVFTGWSDSRLTPTGIQQARLLGKKLKDIKFSVAYQSSLTRSQDTLKEVLAYHPECKEIITDDRIRERNYGVLNGHSHASTIAEYGQAQFDKWHRGWFDKAEGGESFADVEIRVKDFIELLKKTYAGRDINIAISAHGNSIRLFRKILEATSTEDAQSWTIPYDQIFTYTI